MADSMSPTTIVIGGQRTGPTPPATANTSCPNVLHTRIADLIAHAGPPPWAQRTTSDERPPLTPIASPPGGGNRPHWHRDFDEWWVVMAGSLEWELTGGVVLRAQ